jgi:uncharacterized protein YuzE
MPLDATYDHEADALYIRLAHGTRARSVELDEARYLDVDEDGRVLGAEILYPSMGVDVAALANRLEVPVDSLQAAIDEALGLSCGRLPRRSQPLGGRQLWCGRSPSRGLWPPRRVAPPAPSWSETRPCGSPSPPRARRGRPPRRLAPTAGRFFLA